VILDTVIPCNKGYVYHREESGILILRGIVKNACCGFARYQVTFNGNIAVPEGGTAGPISVSLAIDGEPISTSRAIVTPAAAEDFFNVTSTAIITIPRGCCFNISVENTSESPTPATTPAPAIEVQNANLTVARLS
jgi:hypothetical protein